MPGAIHLVPPDQAKQWGRWLEAVAHDFYHTAAYHRFSQETGEGEAWLAVYGDRERYLAWPYLLRPLATVKPEDAGLRDVTSVYGYAGPLAHGCLPGDPFLERARERIAELWRSQNGVSAFTRFHPLLENHRWAGEISGESAVRQGGETISIDLARSPAEHWHDYQASLRNRVNRGRRLGLVTEIDESWSHLEDFARFYRAAMMRNRAAPQYLFPLEYFARLKAALGRQAFLLVTRLGSEVAAAAILIEYCGIVQNHFCMNNEDCLELAPSKVLLDDARRWAGGRGNRVFHLGGGRGACGDSLFAFKAAFSRRRHRFYTGRWILAPGTYERLCGGRAASNDYFPAYRAPLEEPVLMQASAP